MKNIYQRIHLPENWRNRLITLVLSIAVGLILIPVGLFLTDYINDNREINKTVQLNGEAKKAYAEGRYEIAKGKYDEIRKLNLISKETNQRWYYYTFYMQGSCSIKLAIEDQEGKEDNIQNGIYFFKQVVDNEKILDSSPPMYDPAVMYEHLGYAYYMLSDFDDEFEDKYDDLTKSIDAYKYAVEIIEESDKFSDSLSRIKRNISIIEDKQSTLLNQQ